MSEFLTVIAAGLAAASLYSLFGVGLAFVYRVTGVLNFAYGAIASVSGYIAYSLISHELSYPLTVLIAITCGAIVSALTFLLLIIRIPSRSHEAIGILTLGVAIVLQGILQSIYGGEPYTLRPAVTSKPYFDIGYYGVTAQTLINLGIAGVALLFLGVFLNRTKFGLKVRAASEGSLTASMFGINTVTVNTVVWGIGGVLAGIAAILVTPLNQLTPSFMTYYLLVAFVAVVLGGFESILGVVIGAILYGIVSSLMATYLTNRLTSTFSFLIILIVLIFLPKGILGRHLPHVNEPTWPRSTRFSIRAPKSLTIRAKGLRLKRRSRLRSSKAVLLMPVLIGGVTILIAPKLGQSEQLLVAMIAAYVIAALGTDIIYGYSGQLSLGQSGFMLSGAYVSVLAQSRFHIPYLLSLLVAALVCTIIGLILGGPVSRLGGVYLTVITLAFALAVPEIPNFFESTFGGSGGVPVMLPLGLVGTDDRNLHLVILTVVLAVIVAIPVMLLCRSRQGRQWRALRVNEISAAASGIRVSRQKVLAFAIGSGVCGLGGAVASSLVGYLSPESFTLWDSIYLLVAIVIGGRASALGALIGAALVVGLPYATSGSPAIAGLALGVALIFVLMVKPQGTRGLILQPALWILDLLTGRKSQRNVNEELESEVIR